MYPIHYVTIREQHLYKLKKLTLVKVLFFSFNYRQLFHKRKKNQTLDFMLFMSNGFFHLSDSVVLTT